MKGKLVFDKKATDEIVYLHSVPFDATKFDAIAKAFLTLAATKEDVAKIIKLVRRTNQNLYFDFEADEKLLQPFFEKYYPQSSWEQLRGKYQEDRLFKSTGFSVALAKFFAQYKLEPEQVEYEDEKKIISLLNISKEAKSSLIKNLNTDTAFSLEKFVRKYNLQVETIQSTVEPVKIILKSTKK